MGHSESTPGPWLTSDPDQGDLYDQVTPRNPTAEFLVSCFQRGVIRSGGQAEPLEWAQIESGTYETLWVPMAFLRGLASGSARTVLPCTHWRWQLQNFGNP